MLLQAVQMEFKARYWKTSSNSISLWLETEHAVCVPAQGTHGPSVSAIRVTLGNILQIICIPSALKY